MAKSHVLFPPVSENHRGFSVLFYFQSEVLTHATTFSRDRYSH